MLQWMDAEILFLDPNDVGEGSAVLIEHDFDVEVIDEAIDDYGPAVWISAPTITDLDMDRFFDWVQSIVEPLHGDVLEAGPCDVTTTPRSRTCVIVDDPLTKPQ